jgi:inorganic pyrophosphatase
VEGSSGNLLRLPIGIDVPETINAVIEIPYGGRNKIEYDQQNQIFRLDRVLHSPMYYPGGRLRLHSAHAQDGDPLDVLVLVSEPTFSGCVMSVRPIGYLRLIDEGTPDEKILAVPRAEPDYASVTGVDQISPHVVRKIQHFFETYKLLEGKHTSSEGWRDAAEAKRIMESAQRFTCS